jgi:hypothetical protein
VTEILEETKSVTKRTSKTTTPKTESNKQEIDLTIIDKAFDISINDNEEAFISKIGLSLRKIDPSFDPRTFGFKTLTQLFDNIDKNELIKNEVNGLNHPLVRLK